MKAGKKVTQLFFSAENVYRRHQENINAGLNIFDKEKEVVSMLTTLEWAMPLAIHLASILDILLAFVYRKYLHPWRRILEVINNNACLFIWHVDLYMSDLDFLTRAIGWVQGSRLVHEVLADLVIETVTLCRTPMRRPKIVPKPLFRRWIFPR